MTEDTYKGIPIGVTAIPHRGGVPPEFSFLLVLEYWSAAFLIIKYDTYTYTLSVIRYLEPPVPVLW